MGGKRRRGRDRAGQSRTGQGRGFGKRKSGNVSEKQIGVKSWTAKR